MIAYISSNFPALTVTFIYREVEALRRLGVSIQTVSMNRPRKSEISAEATEHLEGTLYLDRIPLHAKLLAFARLAITRPLRMARCLGVLVSARPVRGLRDYIRLIYHWIEAGYLALQLEELGLEHVHAHLVNGPTSIALYLGILSNVPFSFTMHASMIWLDPIALSNKLRRCRFCVSISEYNRQYVMETYGPQYGEKIHVVRCGIEPGSIPVNDSRPDGELLRILSIGQLNARKGFAFLLRACALLKKRGLKYRCTIVGEGEERESLEALHARLELGDHVVLAGRKTQEELKSYLAEAHVFVLPCVVSEDGWRDGIPVALMEAMAARIPVVTTSILGLPELVRHNDTGLLVAPEDPDGLAEAIERLSNDASLRARLTESGADWVTREFNVQVSARRLAGFFGKI